MRLAAAALSLASIATFATADDDWALAVKCAQKNPDINTAIQNFCTKGDIMIPSTYAHEGRGHNGIRVKVGGNCSPAQWLPPQYCNTQFHGICAHNPNGFGSKSFGHNGCQKFQIYRKANDAPKPDPNGFIQAAKSHVGEKPHHKKGKKKHHRHQHKHKGHKKHH